MRDASFEQKLFWRRGIWDKYMLDGGSETFSATNPNAMDRRLDGGALRVDFGKIEAVSEITIEALVEDDRRPQENLVGKIFKDFPLEKR